MKQTSYTYYQRKYGGMWVAISKETGRVVASHEKHQELTKVLRKKRKDFQNVIFWKIEKVGTVSIHSVC